MHVPFHDIDEKKSTGENIQFFCWCLQERAFFYIIRGWHNIMLCCEMKYTIMGWRIQFHSRPRMFLILYPSSSAHSAPRDEETLVLSVWEDKWDETHYCLFVICSIDLTTNRVSVCFMRFSVPQWLAWSNSDWYLQLSVYIEANISRSRHLIQC